MKALLLALALLAWGPEPADAAGRRVALVIGNSVYEHTGKLANPGNDAADMATALKRHGFTVIEGFDLDKAAMDRTIRQFARELIGAQDGVFFYAGHGLQVDGQNYLVPIDAKLDDATGLDFETVRLDLVHKTMERATKTNLIFLDACRDNPLARNLARSLGTRSGGIRQGLAPVESGEGTLISFSTQPGNVAIDGNGRNSPYAAALVRQIAQVKDDLSAMLIAVRNQVMQETGRRQVPWEHSALTARYYFSAPAPQPPVDTVVSPAPAPATGLNYEQQAEIAFWNTIKDSGNPTALQSYLDRFPQGTFAPLARIMIKQGHEAEQRTALAARERELQAAKQAEVEARQASSKDGDSARARPKEPAAARSKQSDKAASVAPTESLRQTGGTACTRLVGVWLGPTKTDMIFRPDRTVTSPAFSDSGPWSCSNGQVVISWKQWGVDRCTLSPDGAQMSCTNSLMGSAFTRTRKSGG